ncbi:MAG: hypothetical protein KDA61_21945, partial [Planctomycetales bacterium]|nr:hypothetical protein [Planctomycetales bacterium]
MAATHIQRTAGLAFLSLVTCAAWLAEPVAVRAAGQSGETDRSVPTSAVADGFEDAKAGPFEKLETSLGTWISGGGRTIVDDKHAKTGRRCLQLTGGEKTMVTLQLADSVDTLGTLSFWAERWTVRKPFSFHIEKQTGDGWREIYNGDAQVRVGREFLNHVRIPLGDDGIRQLRFTCTSPPDTGILIDDIRIAPAMPQKVVSVDAVPFTLPALVGSKASRLLKFKIITTGQLEPVSLIGLRAKLEG